MTGPTRWGAASVALMGVVSGCAGQGEPSDGAVELAPEVPPECGSLALPGAIRQIEEDVFGVEMGACGDLVVQGWDEDGAYWDGALAGRTEIPGSVARLVASSTSRQISAYGGGADRVTGFDLQTGASYVAPVADSDVGFGFVRAGGATVPWGCARGELVVDDEVVMRGLDCAAVSAHEASGRLLVAASEGRELHVIDAVTGASTATGVVHGEQRLGETTVATMRWSADGRVALVQDVRFVDCGDWTCESGGSGVVVIDASTGARIGTLDGKLVAIPGTPVGRATVFTSARGTTLIATPPAESRRLDYLRPDLTFGVVADVNGPAAVSADGAFVVATVGRESELVRVSTSSDEVLAIVAQVDALAVSARGSFVVAGRYDADLARWQLVRWSPSAGAAVVAEAAQPIVIHWVGEGGEVLASGPFEAGSDASRTVLFAPDGSELAWWHGPAGSVIAVGGTLFGEIGANVRSVVVATGRDEIVTRGRLVRVLADATGERVALVVESSDGTGVWAGRRPTE